MLFVDHRAPLAEVAHTEQIIVILTLVLAYFIFFNVASPSHIVTAMNSVMSPPPGGTLKPWAKRNFSCFLYCFHQALGHSNKKITERKRISEVEWTLWVSLAILGGFIAVKRCHCLDGNFTSAPGIQISKESEMFWWKPHPSPWNPYIQRVKNVQVEVSP